MTRRDPITGRWAKPTKFDPPINGPDIDSAPFLRSDGLALLFYSARAGGVGEMDLWSSTRETREGSWSHPLPLGLVVNSPSSDQAPSLSADGLILVFESTREGGHGSYDLYSCRRRTLNEPWSEPRNLGPRINTEDWEGCPRLTDDGLGLVFHCGLLGLRVSVRATRDDPWPRAETLDPTGIGLHCHHPAISEDARMLVCVNRPVSSSGPRLWAYTRVRKAAP